MHNCKNIIYISYDGVMEPLGQSQVVGYLNKIAKKYNCYLISFEKSKDLANKDKLSQSKNFLHTQNIHWTPLRYHKKFKIFSTVFDMLIGTINALRIMRSTNICILHIRGYIPMLIALSLKLFFSHKIIFDMRGFWPDEKADRAGWSRSGIVYKSFKLLEKKFIYYSDAIVVLTDESKEIILSKFLIKKTSQVTVIPTCVDLKLFDHSQFPKYDASPPIINIASLGSVDTAYDINPVMDFFHNFLKYEKGNLIFFNQDSHELITSKAKEFNIPESNIKIQSINRNQIPAAIAQIDVGIFYLKNNYSIKASMPTKIGEFLSMGKPFICNNFNKDIESMIGNNKVGFLHDFDESLKNKTIQELKDLVFNQSTPSNCLQFASTYFSLQEGSNRYLEIYSELLS